MGAAYEISTHDLAYKSCGESDIPNGVSTACYSGVTWEEAKDVCEGAGARLCTVEELENQIPKGTGCGWDNAMLWSMSPCKGGMYIREGVYHVGTDKYCQTDLEDTTSNGGYYTNASIAVRCCADY